MINPKVKIVTPRGSITQITNKNGSVRAELKWDSGFGQEQTNRFTAAQRFIDSETLRYCDPLVPFKTGMAKLSGILGTVIGSGVVKYIAAHARAIYYRIHANFNGAPQRGAYWLERMKITHKQAILRGAGRLAGKR